MQIYVSYVTVVYGYVGLTYYGATFTTGVCVTLDGGITLEVSGLCKFGTYAYNHVGASGIVIDRAVGVLSCAGVITYVTFPTSAIYVTCGSALNVCIGLGYETVIATSYTECIKYTTGSTCCIKVLAYGTTQQSYVCGAVNVT